MNHENLVTLTKAIKANLDHFDMRRFMSAEKRNPHDIDDLSHPDHCGTTACIAGFASILLHKEIAKQEYGYDYLVRKEYMEALAAYLEIGDEQAEFISCTSVDELDWGSDQALAFLDNAIADSDIDKAIYDACSAAIQNGAYLGNFSMGQMTMIDSYTREQGIPLIDWDGNYEPDGD